MIPSPGNTLGAMIASRICHDLISPLGAIGNGVELLSLTGADVGPEISLIGDSVTNANARLRFFRIAFGSASGEHGVSAAEIQSVLGDLSSGGRVRHVWESPADCRRCDAKLIFLALLCHETALAFGGQTTVRRTADGWDVTATGTRIVHDAALWRHLVTNPDEADNAGLTSAQVQFLLLPAELARQGRRASVVEADGSLTISF